MAVITIPPQATISDLVPLMYRARWASFGLSGEVRTRECAELTGLTAEVDQSLFDYEPPPETKVIAGGLFAEAGQSPDYVALQAGKGAAALALEVGRRWLTRNDVAGGQRGSSGGGQSPGS